MANSALVSISGSILNASNIGKQIYNSKKNYSGGSKNLKKVLKMKDIIILYDDFCFLQAAIDLCAAIPFVLQHVCYTCVHRAGVYGYTDLYPHAHIHWN